MERKIKIAIAGASGFVGKALKEFLIENSDYDLVCLSRTDKSELNNERIEWRQCELHQFSRYPKVQDCSGGLSGYAVRKQ